MLEHYYYTTRTLHLSVRAPPIHVEQTASATGPLRFAGVCLRTRLLCVHRIPIFAFPRAGFVATLRNKRTSGTDCTRINRNIVVHGAV